MKIGLYSREKKNAAMIFEYLLQKDNLGFIGMTGKLNESTKQVHWMIPREVDVY